MDSEFKERLFTVASKELHSEDFADSMIPDVDIVEAILDAIQETHILVPKEVMRRFRSVWQEMDGVIDGWRSVADEEGYCNPVGHHDVDLYWPELEQLREVVLALVVELP